MRLKDLFLDYNHHTDEALKHVYTVLKLNKTIEISIDNEKLEPGESDDSEDTEYEFAELPKANLDKNANMIVPSSAPIDDV